MSAHTPSQFALIARHREIAQQLEKAAVPTLEAFAAVVVFSTIGLLLAWRG